MPRIRTVKPDFWEDESIGLISRDARLLFIATWNLADDEGLLRWNGQYLSSAVFMYDEDLDPAAVERLMSELETANLVFSYLSGSANKTEKKLGYIVNFRKHQ